MSTQETKGISKFLKQSSFKIEPEDIVFDDTEFMSGEEKMNVYKKFVRFANNHFNRSSFNKALYNHFHLHCGFIAHYNINGFYEEYFSAPHRYHDEKEVFGKEYASVSFLRIYQDEVNPFLMNNMFGSSGLALFFSHFFEQNRYRLCLFSRGYEDINSAIGRAVERYISLWMEEVSSAVERYNNHKAKTEAEKEKREKKILRMQKEQESPKQLTFEELLAS